MPHIVSADRFPTKKRLREALAEGRRVYAQDPSIFPGAQSYTLNGGQFDELPRGGSITVTNHPKRSWFASITRMHDGTLRVE